MAKLDTSFRNDPHSQDGQPCPANFFGTTDFLELLELEAIYVPQRALELGAAAITGRFDTAHLCGIHGYLFQDIFPWAGELRLVGLSKPGGAPFAAPQFLASALDDLLARLQAEGHLRTLDRDAFAARAGFFLGEINAIHPFHEGNGRTQREFIRQLAAHAGHMLSWAGFTQEQMTVASILAPHAC